VVQKGLTLRALFGPDRSTGGRRAERIRDALRTAGIDAEVSATVERELWEKLIFALVGLGFMTLTRLPIGETLACPETIEVVRGIFAEGIAIGRARGVPFGDDAHDRAFARMREISDINPRAQGSMYFDLIAGKRLEIEAINGVIVRLGRELGIPTPLNGLIYGALKPYAEGTGDRE
jgi:2-dehydropantoate 2-reductase